MKLYTSSGRCWPFKQCLLDYASNVYLQTANSKLFSRQHAHTNLDSLKSLLRLISVDMAVIFEEWTKTEGDCKIIFPDGSVSSFGREAKITALEAVCAFFQSLCSNKKLDLGVDVFPNLHEITTKIAKLYYLTTNEKFKSNAMDVLQLINGSEKYSCLLENVQHPASQNIYLDANKMKNQMNGMVGEQGQKSN